MNGAIAVSKTDPTIRRILAACYPGYRGRKIRIEPATSYAMSDYWDGGSRAYAIAYDLATGRTAPPATATHNPMNGAAHATITIPDGILIVEHSIFMGKCAGIRIYATPTTIAPLLPPAAADGSPQ